VAKPELGSKRQCLSCSTKFFDMNKDPIVCPKCGTVFQVSLAQRAQRAAAVEDEEQEAEAGAELVPLEDADPASEKVAVADDDIEIEDDEAADDTFLEEEEEDADDVADLIDGDIENDEES
jgi:uncharacterized protein (TIGR02300 family)